MASSSTTTTPHKLRIGVMMEQVQLSDITGIDILGNISTAYVTDVAHFAGRPDLASKGTDMEWHYLSTTLEPTVLTPSLRVVPTVTYDDAARDLDILIIGGPKPDFRPEAADRFLKEAFGRIGCVMTTCVGSLWLASAGVLKGRRCTTNREALGMARQWYPETEWVDERWVVDGDLWTSGGAGAGESCLVFPFLICCRVC